MTIVPKKTAKRKSRDEVDAVLPDDCSKTHKQTGRAESGSKAGIGLRDNGKTIKKPKIQAATNGNTRSENESESDLSDMSSITGTKQKDANSHSNSTVDGNLNKRIRTDEAALSGLRRSTRRR